MNLPRAEGANILEGVGLVYWVCAQSRESPSMPPEDQNLEADCSITENAKYRKAAKKQDLWGNVCF